VPPTLIFDKVGEEKPLESFVDLPAIMPTVVTLLGKEQQLKNKKQEDLKKKRGDTNLTWFTFCITCC